MDSKNILTQMLSELTVVHLETLGYVIYGDLLVSNVAVAGSVLK